MNWDILMKQARDCHTKQAWEQFFDETGEILATSSHAKPIEDIFKILRQDPQSLLYDPRIWGRLIQGCLSSWSLELGHEITEFTKKINSPKLSIPTAQLFLESGSPTIAREIANRTLRLSSLPPAERLQLAMIVVSCYAEEGKREKSIRLLSEIQESLQSPSLDARERADLLTNMGRMEFFLGRYSQAGEQFYQASILYRNLSDWEAAAKTIFNTAVCYLNGGTDRRADAFAMIEECRRLAEAEKLPGPLAHCEASYGTDAFQHGNFRGALEHLRRALNYLPNSDKSYRKLRIVSMLASTYLAMGRYHLAKKLGHQAAELIAHDDAARRTPRHDALTAELLWEDGLIEESQGILRQSTLPLEMHGVHTLDELSTVARFTLQNARLNVRNLPTKLAADQSLQRNPHACLDYKYALGEMALTTGDTKQAELYFGECVKKGQSYGYRLHETLGTLGLIQTLLYQKRAKEASGLISEFETLVARMGETPLKTQVMFVQAAQAYQLGDFTEFQRILRLASKSKRQSFADRFVLGGWIATIEGRASRLTGGWQSHLLARYTRIYFAPSLKAIDQRHYRISDHYIVSLERHPSLADLLNYLLLKSSFSATTAEIQSSVWKQSLHTQGWQQKIRNTIMRLRDFFPYTIAPIIMHTDTIALFSEAITIHPRRIQGATADTEIVRLLDDIPMSSFELASRLQISPATTKRLLKKLTDEHAVAAFKDGRNVYYRSNKSHLTIPP